MPGFDLNFELLIKLTSPMEVRGSIKGTIERIASLEDALPGDISFLANRKYSKLVSRSKASVILVPEDYEGEPSSEQAFLLHGNPSRAIDLIAEQIQRQLSPRSASGIHQTAVVHNSVVVPESAHVGAFAVLEEGAIIGESCLIQSHAVVGRFAKIGDSSVLKSRASLADYCEIGKDCMIHSGAVVGSDGFGYETVDGKHLRSPQIGIVVLEDRVDIGSNSTIDRARFHETRIGEGTKIDNLVQIAHNVTIGKGCFFAAQVGIAGSTKIGDFVLIGGASGVSGHLTIGDFCQIGGSTAVYKNLPPKTFVSGCPSMPYYQAQKFNVLRTKLPELFRRVSTLESQPPSNS